MPLYEYECKKCHHRFERIQKFSDPHVKKCPKCGGPIEQVISAPAVQFKGSGWYVTDYAKKSSTGSASSSSNGDSASSKDSKAKVGRLGENRKFLEDQMLQSPRARRNPKALPKRSNVGASVLARAPSQKAIATSGCIPAPPGSGFRTHTPAQR